MIALFRRLTASLLIVSLTGLSLPLPAHAGMIGTDSLSSPERARIINLVDRANVRAQLQLQGVSAADVKARIAALTDDEAATLAERIDSLPAGGESVLGVLLIVFLVLLFTDIMGWTKIFPFTRPVQ